MADMIFAVCDLGGMKRSSGQFDAMEIDLADYPCCSSSVACSGWSYLPADMVCMIVSKALLTATSSAMSRMSLVNKHWCREVSKAMRTLEPKRYGTVEEISRSIRARFSDVTSLKLTHVRMSVTDESLSRINSLSKLTRLDLSWCNELTDKGLGAVGKMSGLTDLNLACCKKITDRGIGALLWLRALNTLNLRACEKVTNAGIELLGSISSLTHLDLWGCENITKDGLIPFVKRRVSKEGVRHLSLNGCTEVDSECLEKIIPTMNLTYLNVSRCQISDECLSCLKSSPNLTTLCVNQCDITDEGLARIACLTSLTSLRLGGNDRITDLGVAMLTQLTNLRSLDVHECRHGITEEGLISLQPLTSLTHMDVSENERLPSVLARLCNLAPSVHSFWF
ncbi:hypothetical protein BSKO_04898 [Bryopsis sp. KO-2023]|nr:hypothetical protein BSKO_04898 [Bryopsis sp. KO-2023]